MTDQPEKLDLSSHDIAGDKTQELLSLFPEVRTEADKVRCGQQHFELLGVPFAVVTNANEV